MTTNTRECRTSSPEEGEKKQQVSKRKMWLLNPQYTHYVKDISPIQAGFEP